VPEDEFQAFADIMRVDLPSSFRIQRCLPERDQFVKFLETNFFQPLRKIEDENIHCPEPIPFIPYAYQTNNGRATIRSTPKLNELHQLLISEMSNGTLSRQEAVSMVPPLLLDIQPHHYVLDACASPGSKTMQIAELMHENNKAPGKSRDILYFITHI
jgi:16S rRNA C967 or C1407 C5-methylase (RsmB/RsmF family)